jgi:PmbA protein
MTSSLSDVTQSLLEQALRAGAEAADVVAVEGHALTIDIRDRALEQAERAEGVDIGLRVLIGQKQALVSASDVRESTLAMLAERAVAMAQEAPEDPYVGLAEPEQLARDWNIDVLELYDPAPEPSPAELQDEALRAEAAALAVKGVAQVQSATAAYHSRRIQMAATNGFSAGFRRTDKGLSCVAIAGTGTGMERDGDSDSRVFQSDLRSPEEIGAKAAARTVAQLGARKPPTGAYPVMFDERISGSLIGHLLSAANGSAIARGASWLRDALGELVLPDHLSLVEDPMRVRVSASRPFDAEGLPTQKRLIVDQGVLTGWTLDLATGRKLGMPSTANAKRGTSGPPSPSSWNVALTQGDKTQAELLAEMGTGLLVTGMIGSTINSNTGDYSRGASGFWVENGEITHPVNECTIAGSLPEMLRRIIPANDARGWLSRVVPSLLVEGMTLAGE